MKKMLLAALMAAISMGSQAASPTLAGQTISAYLGSVSAPVERYTDLGDFAPFVVVNGPSDKLNFNDVFSLDVDGDHFTVTFYAEGTFGNDTALHLDNLTFLGEPGEGVGQLTGVTLSSNLGDLPVNVTNDSITVDISNRSVVTQSYFSGKFQVSSVPEPGTLLLSGLGLMAIASLRVRRGAAAR